MNKIDNIKPTAYATIQIENKLLFSANECNGLFYIDLDNGITNFIKPFPGSSTYIFKQHIKAILYDNQIVFIPMYGCYIHIFNIRTSEIQYKYIGERDKGKWFARDAFIVKDNIYMLPYDLNDDFKVFDIKSNEVVSRNSFKKSCISYMKDEMKIVSNSGFLSAKSCICGDKLFFSVFPYSFIGCYDLISDNIEFRRTVAKNIMGLHIYNDILFLLSADDVNIHGLKDNGFGDECIYKSSLEYNNLDGVHRPYLSMVENKMGLYVVPAHCRRFLRLKDQMFVSLEDLSEQTSEIPDNEIAFYSIASDENNLFLFSIVSSFVYVFNSEMKLKKKFSVECNDKNYKEYITASNYKKVISRHKGSHIREYNNFPLLWFAKAIMIDRI